VKLFSDTKIKSQILYTTLAQQLTYLRLIFFELLQGLIGSRTGNEVQNQDTW